jgi:hypothetical protein
MLQINSHTDPIVQILQLAYRRGLAVRQAESGQDKTADSGNLGRETLSAAGQDNQQRLPSNEQFYPTGPN